MGGGLYLPTRSVGRQMKLVHPKTQHPLNDSANLLHRPVETAIHSSKSILCHFSIVFRLQAQPPAIRQAEEAAQAQAGVRRDAAFAGDNVADTLRRGANFLGKVVWSCPWGSGILLPAFCRAIRGRLYACLCSSMIVRYFYVAMSGWRVAGGSTRPLVLSKIERSPRMVR